MQQQAKNSLFDCTPVFQANYTSRSKINVNQGGTSSSKTYSIMQVLFLKAIEESKQIITVAGQDIPNLKKGAYRDAETIYANSDLLKVYISNWNKTERIIQFWNGSIIEFNSYDDIQDAKNGKRDYLFLNEANGIDYQIYWQLEIRTRKQVFLDYNPSAHFWVHDNLIGKPGVRLFISDHRHNSFLTQEEHDKIENIKDPELWKVYARGITGNIVGMIFPDWQMIADDLFPKDAAFFGGLDFGYTNDPTAGVKIARVAESIFLKQLCYTPGLAPIQVKQLYYAEGFTADIPVYCEHDPDQIAQLRRLGLCAMPARKGPGSINSGILLLKQFKIYYTASSHNIADEKKRYVWAKDKITGKTINTPVDQFNHLMDASRYGAYTHYFKG